jgi:serine/threonine protein kinase
MQNKDRDVKLQNVLFQYNSNDPRKIKIVDFGLSVILQGNQTTRDFCGSLGYISPEVYERKHYRFEVDMFAFGVLLFRLLSGERPFPSNNQDVLQRHTVELRYNVHGRDWRTVSDSAKDLIRRLLINRQERWTAEACLNHEWFSSSGESILRPDLSIIGDRSDGESRSRAFVKVCTFDNSIVYLLFVVTI